MSEQTHCPACGCAFADDNETEHECPPGFALGSRSVASDLAELPVSLALIEGPMREGGFEVGDLTAEELRQVANGLRGSIRVTARGLAMALNVNRELAARSKVSSIRD